MKIVITGTPKYIKYLSEHLVEEHPSTKKRMRVNGKKIKKPIKGGKR